MKTLQAIVSQPPVFMNDWTGIVDVLGDFNDVYINQREYEATTAPYPNVFIWEEKKQKINTLLLVYSDTHILFASYGSANYSGDAWVLFEKSGELFEVNGGHCSCYGLEGQWNPEKVTLNALEHRLIEGTFGEDDYAGNTFKERLCDFLGVEYRRNSL